MRAILLQKDDYGLQNDRLHGRYGLTGKPTLTQTSIAGSLGASFQAGQEVALTNLRGLNGKIREAQLALSGASANIDSISGNIEKINDASGQVNQLLANSAWTKFWNGAIEPNAFYAEKNYEDKCNELMAGEPGYPVVSYGNNYITLPRTPFWDHIFEIRNHKTDPKSIKMDDLCFINNDGGFATKIATSQNLRTIKSKTNALMGILVGMAALAVVVSTVTYINPGVSLMLEAEIGIAMLAITVMDKLVDILTAREITELGGRAGRGETYLSTNHSMFDFQNWIEITMMDPNAQIILDGIQSTLIATLATYATGCGIQLTGYMMYMLGTLPWIKAAGWALMQAGYVINSSVAATLEYTLIPSIVVMIGTYMVGGICSRSPGKDENANKLFNLKADFAQYADEVDETPYSSQLFTCYGTLGQLPLTGSINSIPGISKLFSFITAAQSKIASNLGNQFSKLLKERYILGNSGYNGNSSEIRIYNYLPFKETEEFYFEDFWGCKNFSTCFQYNDKAYGSSGASNLTVPMKLASQSKSRRDYISIKARIYDGNYYKIKCFEEERISHTVVIKSHMITKDNWEYFSELALVCLNNDIDHLYLHHERNAIYNKNPYNTGTSDILHAEQSYWNFDYHKDISVRFNNRAGRLNYCYADLADGVRIQIRPGAYGKENVLEDSVINTEYKWDDFYHAAPADADKNFWGGLQSYGNVKNR